MARFLHPELAGFPRPRSASSMTSVFVVVVVIVVGVAFNEVCGTMNPSGWVMGYSRKCPFPIKGRDGGKAENPSTFDLRLQGLESDRRLSTLKGLSFCRLEALLLAHKLDCWLLSDESSSEPPASWWCDCLWLCVVVVMVVVVLWV